MSGDTPKIAIIGAGFSGLCAAIRLRKAGIESFTLFEKADRLGGTWRANTYPGAECDIPSALYSYSFELNPNWPNKWSHQPDILEYIESVGRKHDIHRFVRFETEVAAARFDQRRGLWTVETAGGATEKFDIVVSGVGQLSRPRRPAIEGLDSFAGDCFHSAEWDHGCDLEGKSVGVIGNAASATQFVPRIAPAARRVTVFQRTPNWIFRKNDREYSAFEKTLARKIPGVAWLYRFYLWFFGEAMLYPMMGRNRFFKWLGRQNTLKYLEQAIDDRGLREKLIPGYPLGAKRILWSDDYYEALNRDDVDLVTSPIVRVEPEGVVTGDDRLHRFDVLILGTGFMTNDFLYPIEITGRDGARLDDVWRAGAEAYLGIATHGFPNLFMMYGPNTNLGHNSIIFMIECQTRYILSCIGQMCEKNLQTVEVKAEVQAGYNEKLQERLRKKAWAAVDDSWYLKDGRVTNNWAGSTVEYWWRTRRCDLDRYETRAAAEQWPASRAAAAAG